MRLEDIKLYLKVEHDDEDSLLSSLLSTSKQLCLDVLRKSEAELTEDEVAVFETAVHYGVAYLYEHREKANHKELKETLYHLLLSNRMEAF
ncbi:head-tail connector protein [Streptococcus pluranimalium]|uniref:head-tail connector protein n=1 Tax=Streptococcus pluranimalium TaxID=82348 RepID=UPI00313A4C59